MRTKLKSSSQACDVILLRRCTKTKACRWEKRKQQLHLIAGNRNIISILFYRDQITLLIFARYLRETDANLSLILKLVVGNHM